MTGRNPNNNIAHCSAESARISYCPGKNSTAKILSASSGRKSKISSVKGSEKIVNLDSLNISSLRP